MTTKTITVYVTQEDIDRAVRFSGRHILTVAIRRATGDCSLLSGSLWLHRGEERIGDLPQVARDFVVAFDDDKPVSPFSFPLTVPETVTATQDGV